MSRKRGAAQRNPAAEAWWAGVQQVYAHPLFAPLAHRANLWRADVGGDCPADGWAVVHEGGRIQFHPTRRGEPAEWAYVTAHALLSRWHGSWLRSWVSSSSWCTSNRRRRRPV